jgi:hypothetical protein
MARQSAADYAQRNIVRIISKNGVAHLANYAANLLAVENLGRDPKKSYNFVCESGYFVNYCSFGGM